MILSAERNEAWIRIKLKERVHSAKKKEDLNLKSLSVSERRSGAIVKIRVKLALEVSRGVLYPSNRVKDSKER
jgi:hypothetical protein